MSDKAQPSASSASTAPRNVPQIKRPATTEARKTKPVIKTAIGKVGPMKARPVLPLKVDASAPTSAMSMRSKPLRTPVPPPPAAPTANDTVMDQYEMYLQNYVMNATCLTLEKLQVNGHSDAMGARGAALLNLSPSFASTFSNKVCVHNFEHLKRLETIRGAFANSVDFTGEETLVEIQSILSKKYDQVLIEGATLEGPLFQDHQEIETTSANLRSNSMRLNDETNVAGFCQNFENTMRKLSAKSKTTKSSTLKLKETNLTLLENCSLLCSDMATQEKMQPDDDSSSSDLGPPNDDDDDEGDDEHGDDDRDDRKQDFEDIIDQ